MADRMPPKFLFLQVNQRCNLRCLHCAYWKLSDDGMAGYISLSRRREILREFADLGGRVVVTCGGEAMLDFEEYFQLMNDLHQVGLKCFSVVNGTRIRTEATADRMMAEGPDEITVSLDSHREEVHDRLRGVKGAFQMAVKALRLLIAARERRGTTKPIYAMNVLCEDVWRDLDGFYNFVLNDVGADKLKMNIIQPSFGDASGRDEFFASQLIRDVDGVMQMLRSCDVKYGLHLNPAWLRHVEAYLRGISRNGNARAGWLADGAIDEHICNSYDRNIMMDLWGLARLCFNPRFPGMQTSRYGDLRRFWNEWSLPIRDQMVSCNRYCGISHSTRRESATLREMQAQERF